MMGIISRISGPVIEARGMKGAKMFELVRAGTEKLIGEIIQLREDNAIIQVYEDTNGLQPGEIVVSTGAPLQIDLGPGLLNNIYDGVGRPLEAIAKKSGSFISKGIDVPGLDKRRKFKFNPAVKKGDKVKAGDIIGTVKETGIIEHRIVVPGTISGKIIKINRGNFTVEETIAVVKTRNGEERIRMHQKWAVRRPRPIRTRLPPSVPLVTGQRVFDTFFPIAKGGTAAIPGPFGAGKTVAQQNLAKWSDADIIVYVGCGERGNEMTEVLNEFPSLLDPKTGKPLMERTVIVANTSNMPVAAREASVYTGVTIAEYFRDMGYSVALMADSTSRWAEAMREISSRLEEMPGEEGYPAYLSSRLAQFYERAGRVKTLGNKEGAVSIVGAVSPPGGDFSEPVTQNTLRITKAFWALDASLAYRRHFPSVNWLTSYSLYLENTVDYFNTKVSPEFTRLRKEAMVLLQKESELKEIVQLIGPDALGEDDKLMLDTAKSLREDFLQQSAYDDVDSYCSLEKQYLMLKLIMSIHKLEEEKLGKGLKTSSLQKLKFKERIARMKFSREIRKEVKDITLLAEKELEQGVREGLI
ncbi:V-type ATP synthase subunit A [Candidatus Woesearchaeota archaeon]|nr:V-type ATP synthase subunit A [Candidatus Woesearchaeota archaeon]